MLLEPHEILGLSECGEFAFVTDTNTGIPISEITDIELGIDKARAAPPNPYVSSQTSRKTDLGNGSPRILVPLSKGNEIEIRMKFKVTKKEFDRIKDKVFAMAEVAFLVYEEFSNDE